MTPFAERRRLRRRTGALSAARSPRRQCDRRSGAEPYRNMVLNRVNESGMRLAVFKETYRWYVHPASDELFLVVEGVATGR
jgi:hypothetical protein